MTREQSIRVAYVTAIVLALVGAMMFERCVALMVLSVAFLVFALGYELEQRK